MTILDSTSLQLTCWYSKLKLPSLQAQQAATDSQQEVEEWAKVVQQLGGEALHSVGAGQAVVTSVLETLQGLEEQQRHALEDLAGKDDALGAAKAKIGGLCC